MNDNIKIEPIEMDNGIGFRGSVSLSKEEIEKRVDFLEEHSKEFNKLVIKAENELYIKELLKRNNQLQSNWNSLREWLEEQHQFIIEIPAYTKEISIEHKTMEICYENVLDKMNELEGKDKDGI